MERSPEERKRQADAQARYRARQKALGIKRVTSERERERQRKYVAARRAKARASDEKLPSDQWHKQNADKHRNRVRRWRARNYDRSQEINRQTARRRRSTPWGAINSCMWPSVHNGIKKGIGPGKYNVALGYTWQQLASHLESRFLPSMTWENWGDAWELDHIIPLSRFKYESIDDPLFKEAWALSNLRPLWKEANASKGCKIV